MSVVDVCGFKQDDKTGFAQKTVPAVYTLASGVCNTGPAANTKTSYEGLLYRLLGGSSMALVNVGKRTMFTNSVCHGQCADMPSPFTELAKDPAGCPTSPTDVNKKCTGDKAYSLFYCSDSVSGTTATTTDNPSPGAQCRSFPLSKADCVKAGLATQEDLDKKGEGACNLARFNPEPACSPPQCASTILSSSCDSIPLSATAYHVKTMEDLKDDLPDRPINSTFWIIIAAVVLVVIVIIVVVLSSVCKKKAGGGDAAVKPEPAAATRIEVVPRG